MHFCASSKIVAESHQEEASISHYIHFDGMLLRSLLGLRRLRLLHWKEDLGSAAEF